MRRAHLLRWRPRQHAQRTGSTPLVLPSGAALHLDPSHHARRPLFSRRGGLVLVAALASGCGYTFGGNLPPHVKTIAVPMFRNLTQQPAIAETMTSAVVTAFANTGRLKVVSLAQADSILEGEAVEYNVKSIAFATSTNAQDYRLRVRPHIPLPDA